MSTQEGPGATSVRGRQHHAQALELVPAGPALLLPGQPLLQPALSALLVALELAAPTPAPSQWQRCPPMQIHTDS
jgi:hypothetical protein